MTDPDVVVVGAGAAGIAAARELLARKRSVVVLEAGGRAGGRAYTDATGFDHGAAWLHAAERNPLVPLARTLPVRLLLDSGRRIGFVGGHIGFAEGRRTTPPERRARAAAARALAAAAARAVGGPDVAVGAIAPRGGRWDATVAHFEGTIISAAEFEHVSLHDWWANALEGSNLVPAIGLGALVARLAEGLPITFGAAVERIDWDGAPVVAGAFGTLRPRACLVTVSTGVLAAGGIRFSPALPAALGDAVAALPLGQAMKVAIRARWGERLGAAPFTDLERRVEARDDQPPIWVLWPAGRDHAVGYIGGTQARALESAGPAEAHAFARGELARLIGARRLARTFRPGATVTRWGADPLFRGAYSYAVPGGAGARAVLRDAALLDGRLRLAGEACHATLAGTVGGAWESGVAAARALHDSLR